MGAQALTWVAARLSSTGHIAEAAMYLHQVHSEPATALRLLGLRRLEAGDMPTAYEALLASAKLRESVEVYDALAAVLGRAGDTEAAAKHRMRAKELAAQVHAKKDV